MPHTHTHTHTHTLPAKMNVIRVRKHGEGPVNYHVRDYYHCVHQTKDTVILPKKSRLIDTGVSFSFTSDFIALIALNDVNFEDVLHMTRV